LREGTPFCLAFFASHFLPRIFCLAFFASHFLPSAKKRPIFAQQKQGGKKAPHFCAAKTGWQKAGALQAWANAANLLHNHFPIIISKPRPLGPGCRLPGFHDEKKQGTVGSEEKRNAP